MTDAQIAAAKEALFVAAAAATLFGRNAGLVVGLILYFSSNPPAAATGG